MSQIIYFLSPPPDKIKITNLISNKCIPSCVLNKRVYMAVRRGFFLFHFGPKVELTQGRPVIENKFLLYKK